MTAYENALTALTRRHPLPRQGDRRPDVLPPVSLTETPAQYRARLLERDR